MVGKEIILFMDEEEAADIATVSIRITGKSGVSIVDSKPSFPAARPPDSFALEAPYGQLSSWE